MRSKGKHIRLLYIPLVLTFAALSAVGTYAAQSTADRAQLRDTAGQYDVIERELHPGRYTGSKSIQADTLWHPDILEGYEAVSVNLGKSFDGPVSCTVVRRMASVPTNKAVLYVHGFNDYFFQSEMGELFNGQAINFYAVDLRRYGRSLRPWQYPFNVRDFKEYFEDIDAALRIIRADGNSDITLSGHSTGGLTVSLYAAMRGSGCGVRRVVTDSPFLEWNFNAFYRRCLIPAVTLFGAISPDTKIPQGDCDAYSHSLLRQYHGEWEYNTDWKMVVSPPVTASWIRAVSRAQSKVMRHGRNITVPVLVMHSSTGTQTCGWTPECMEADVVLNPADIQKRGQKLGRNPVVTAIDSGMHDLILSRPEVRSAAYDTIFRFIARH